MSKDPWRDTKWQVPTEMDYSVLKRCDWIELRRIVREETESILRNLLKLEKQ